MTRTFVELPIFRARWEDLGDYKKSYSLIQKLVR